MQRLGTTLNRLLERLDTSLNRQRRFVADFAHELRSPVTAIRSQAEVALVRHHSGRVGLDASRVSAGQVDGDPAQLGRAVRHVLDKAARYATTRVTISLRTMDPQAALVIADDGPGIPEADRDRVRERFARLDDARTRSTGGVGLDLAAVDETVQLHHGQLRIEDASPGAQIDITLPLADTTD